MRAIRLDAGAFERIRARVRETPQTRRLHRLHAVLLVARGLSCRQAARLLGASPRSVEYWAKRYAESGEDGLNAKIRSGRPPLLTEAQVAQLRAAESARRWDGPGARAYIERRWGVKLGLRRVQALLALIRRVGGA